MRQPHHGKEQAHEHPDEPAHGCVHGRQGPSSTMGNARVLES